MKRLSTPILITTAFLFGFDSSPSAPEVTLTSPSDGAVIWDGRVDVAGFADDADGTVVSATLEVSSSLESSTTDLALDSNGDFSTRAPLVQGADNTITVTAVDDDGESGDAVRTVQNGCGGQSVQPAYENQTPPTWQGDYIACGQNGGSTVFLVQDIDGNETIYTAIEGSLILENTSDSNLLNAANVTSIGADFIIRGQHFMETLDGIDSAAIAGRVIIHGNHAALTDISGLYNLANWSTQPVSIQITDNAGIPTCEVEALRDHLVANGYQGTFEYFGNDDSATCS